LEDREQLDRLPGALVEIDRPDLVTALDAAGWPEPGATAPSAGTPSAGTTPHERRRGGESDDTFLDRDPDCIGLQQALTVDRPTIIVVHGAAGVGKTRLMCHALEEYLADQTPVPHIRWHGLRPGDRFDARTLVADIEDHVEHNRGLRRGESLLGRLEVALESRESTLVIVVDSVERLLHPATRQVDLDLDEAFELVATRRGHRVKVVLITTDRPEVGAGSSWPRTARWLPVQGLPEGYFVSYLRDLDRGGVCGLADLPADTLTLLCDLLEGNPRLANLAYAVLASGSTGIVAERLTERLCLIPPGSRPRFLTDELVRTLPAVPRRVLEALSVVPLPLTEANVSKLLPGKPSESEVTAALRGLVARHVVCRTDDKQFYLQAPDAARILDRMSGDPEAMRESDRDPLTSLRHDAANLLSDLRPGIQEVRTLADLDLYFAELELLLPAGLYGSAYELIDTMDQVLQRWNRGALLTNARETVRGQLPDDFKEMANLNALGDIYAARGSLDEAEEAYTAALAHASASTWPEGRRRILINIGSLCWERNDTDAAVRHYLDALAMAQEHEDHKDRMYALEGLANCHRRRGAYPEAVQYAEEALAAAQLVGSEQASIIAGKLARWYAELGRWPDAERRIDTAEQEAREYGDPVLLARCLDARADLRLAQNNVATAIELAGRAADAALDVHDPVTLLQARTTLCLAHLKDGRLVEAAREIERAARYRRPGRSLAVLALHALVCLKRGDTDEADRLFSGLLSEATKRRRRDGQDFAAWDFEGFALCGAYRGRDSALAADAFARARAQTRLPTPGLVDRLVYLLEELAATGSVGGLPAEITVAVAGPRTGDS
jgi:tetratricopeptide (TPR) repeat protein